MGAIIPKLMKPVRRFNVDNRAQRVISKEKPVPAPHHVATAQQLKAAMEVNPNFMETQSKKDIELDERLKSVFVTSTDPQVEHHDKQNPDRPLPQLRFSKPELEFGIYQPLQVPEGKCTLHQVVEFLAKHREEPEKYSSSIIAEQYKLDKKVVENILEYYQLYRLVVPDSLKKKDIKPSERLKKFFAWEDESIFPPLEKKTIDDK